MQDEIVTKVE